MVAGRLLPPRRVHSRASGGIVVLAQDDFTRANGSLGTAPTGGAWNVIGTPTWAIASNLAKVSSTSQVPAVAILPVTARTCTAYADMYLSAVSANTGLCLLSNSAGTTYLNIQLNESVAFDRIAISKRVAGVTTFLIEDDIAGLQLGSGYTMAAVLTPTMVTVYVDGVQRLQYTFTSQDLIDLTGGVNYCGLRSFWGSSDEDGGSRWDRFLINTAQAPFPVGRSPAAPWNVLATNGGSGQAVVQWGRGGNGGLPLVSYTITSSHGETFTGIDPSVTSFTATGLSNVAQTFTVVAINSAGTSLPGTSNSVTPVTATVPGAPTGLAASSPGNASTTLTWTPPASDGGATIVDYVATSSPGGLTQHSGGTGTTIVFGGLTNGTTYTFTVQAINGVGTGSPSSPSNPVTPSSGAPGTNYLANPSGHGYFDATNTGGTATARTVLDLAGSGGKLTLTNGQTLVNKDVINGRVVTSGGGATAPQLQNVTITYVGGSQSFADGWTGTGRTLVTDVEISGNNTAQSNSVDPGAAAFLRVNAHGGQDVIDGGAATWNDSFMHDCIRSATSHDDVYQIISAGGASNDTTIDRCTMYPAGPLSGSDYMNSVFFIGQQRGDIGAISINNSLLSGGNNTVSDNWSTTAPNTVPSSDRPGPYHLTSTSITNSRFGRWFRYAVRISTWMNPPGTTTATWTNNIYDDNGTSAP